MRKFLILMIVLLITNVALSQNVKFGIKAGVNISSVSNPTLTIYNETWNILENAGEAFGFHGGGFSNISFGKYLGLQTELLFSMQGGKQRLSSDALEGQPVSAINISRYRFNYINLPVLLEIKPVENLGFLIGPQFGYNVYRSENYKGYTSTGSAFDNENIKVFGINPFNSFDVAIVFGIQYAAIEHLNIGLRYNHGLTNSISSELININGSWVKAETRGWKNRVFQLSVGWIF